MNASHVDRYRPKHELGRIVSRCGTTMQLEFEGGETRTLNLDRLIQAHPGFTRVRSKPWLPILTSRVSEGKLEFPEYRVTISGPTLYHMAHEISI